MEIGYSIEIGHAWTHRFRDLLKSDESMRDCNRCRASNLTKKMTESVAKRASSYNQIVINLRLGNELIMVDTKKETFSQFIEIAELAIAPDWRQG